MSYSDIYKKDLVDAQGNVVNLEKLKNSKVLITGVGGLICSALADFLMFLNDLQNYGIEIYAAARKQEKIKSRFGKMCEREDFHFLHYDAEREITSEISFDYIVHGAGNANPGAYVKEPVETMLANIIGINYVLKYAALHKCKRVLYVSSSEVYGKKAGTDAYSESDYSYVDILNPRACYPSSKRAAETLCISYGK